MAPTDKALAISQDIMAEPMLYLALGRNPYAPGSAQIISKRFPHTKVSDVIRAIVLAEPGGIYAEDFNPQEDVEASATRRFTEYCKEYAKELEHLQNYEIYNVLFSIIFESNGLDEIQRKYSREQRIALKTLIVDFVEAHAEKKARPKLLLKYGAVMLPLLVFITYATIEIQRPVAHKEEEQILAIETENISRVFPVRLRIPSIEVDALIEHVGVTRSGEMGVPSTPSNLGWFNFGPLPGEPGNAVIAGHFDGESGKAGVFANLDKVKPGDKLYVEDGKGKTITFIVREKRILAPGYAAEVFSKSDSAHLNLVTCDGMWNETKKTYDKRLVVFADLAD